MGGCCYGGDSAPALLLVRKQVELQEGFSIRSQVLVLLGDRHCVCLRYRNRSSRCWRDGSSSEFAIDCGNRAFRKVQR